MYYNYTTHDLIWWLEKKHRLFPTGSMPWENDPKWWGNGRFFSIGVNPQKNVHLISYRTYDHLGWPAILDGGAIYTIVYIYIYIFAWNPNDLCFDWKRPCFAGIYIYIYMC